MTDPIAARLTLAQTAARAAGAHALALFADRASLTIETKIDALDMVSRADREAEDIIRAHVRAVVERFRPATAVLAHNEIHPRVRIRTIGTV